MQVVLRSLSVSSHLVQGVEHVDDPVILVQNDERL